MNAVAAIASEARASSTANAPSSSTTYLVASKYNTKCRRVPRIISRRLYCYRRKSASRRPRKIFSSQNCWSPDDQDFSAHFLDLSNLDETVFDILAKYPNRRSYSADSDPVALLHCEMNKSVFFNHSLMKRRYSLPETVMRKHKLQENQLHNQSLETPYQSSLHTSNVKDESCQTEEPPQIQPDYTSKMNNSLKKNSKNKRRESGRCFRKSNSYCQYRSLSMYHKRMMARYRDTQSLGSLESLHSRVSSFEIENKSVPSNEEVNPSNNTTLDHTCKLNREHIIATKEESPSPLCKFEKLNNQTCYYPQLIDIDPLPTQAYLNDKISNSSQRERLKNCDNGIDQNTNGHHTVNGSHDNITYHRTPESEPLPKVSSKRGKTTENHQDKKVDDLFPITYHSESTFVHPYQKGFLSHKELHHISIQVVPDINIENVQNDYYKTEIKVNVNESTKDDQPTYPKEGYITEDLIGQGKGLHPNETAEELGVKINSTPPADVKGCGIQKNRIIKYPSPLDKIDTLETNSSCDILSHCCAQPVEDTHQKLSKMEDMTNQISAGVQEIHIPSIIVTQNSFPEDHDKILDSPPGLPPPYPWNSTSSHKSQSTSTVSPITDNFCDKPIIFRHHKLDNDDCTVSTNLYPNEPNNQKLKIEIDVNNVDLSTNLQDIFLGCKIETDNEWCTKKPKSSSKYNSKLALSYLFQKLGDTYPKRSLLKQPAFNDSSQYRCYYSDPSKIATSTAEVHPQVLYNNQTYDILSDNLLPYERCNFPQTPGSNKITKLAEVDDHSDSDISIPDSLEEVQHNKPKNNKYQKYDEKLTRGDMHIASLPKAKKNTNVGISYFFPLEDDHIFPTVNMPAVLKEKLRKREDSISKHLSCSESQKKPCKNTKLIHKQIQTCLNAEESLKKRQKNIAVISKLTKEESSDLNERITDILLTGLRLQEDKPVTADNRPTTCQSVQTEETQTPEFRSPEKDFGQDSTQAENNLYEMFSSEEEVGRIHTTNYYRAFKKSKKIYYPTKVTERLSQNHEEQQNHPTFSKYQRKLREFKQQMKTFSPSKDEENLNIICENSLLPYSKAKKREKVFKIKNVSKIPGPRNTQRFCQRFEAIPEEMSSGSIEVHDVNGNTLGCPEVRSQAEDGICNKESIVDTGVKVENLAVEQIPNKQIADTEFKETTKSRKGRDSLYSSHEQEELITLSKGWINFYLLKNSTEENDVAEECEDENIALSETVCIPQQYSVHVHATRDSSDLHTAKSSSTFPGLCTQSAKRNCKSEKLKKLGKTCLPDIGNPSHLSTCCDVSPTMSHKKDLLPKLSRSHSDESEGGRSSLQLRNSGAEPVIEDETSFGEKSASTTTTCSNRSESPVNDLADRKNVKKLQGYQRPRTYHSARNNDNSWLLTVEGSHNSDSKGSASDIQMQLHIKNQRQGVKANQHSWKFTVRGQDTDTNTNDIRRSGRCGRSRAVNYCLPHLNVDYKMLPLSNYGSSVTSCSENNSRCSSDCSFKERKYSKKINFNSHFQNKNKFDDVLTVTGSAITPERKPRVPTMSERDLTRRRLIKPTGGNNPL